MTMIIKNQVKYAVCTCYTLKIRSPDGSATGCLDIIDAPCYF